MQGREKFLMVGLMLRVAEPARQAVIESLKGKGLAQADLAQADIMVNLSGQSVPRVEVKDYGYQPAPIFGPYYGYQPMGGYRNVQVTKLMERTLSIEIFDSKTKELVWVGWSKTTRGGPVVAAKLQEVIRNILAQFPAGNPTTTPAAK